MDEKKATAEGHDCAAPNPVTRITYKDDDAGRAALQADMATYDCGGAHQWVLYNTQKGGGQYELFVRWPEIQ